MKIITKDRLLFLLFAAVLGALAGAVVWGFFWVMDLGLEFFWTTVPARCGSPLYPLALCLGGGLLIGLWQKKCGDYPETLETVMAQVKAEGGYPYHNMGQILVAALLPLVFGAAVGPEAGLTGVIAGLCTWVGDKFKRVLKDMRELAAAGTAATLSVIFNAPFFGLSENLEQGGEKVELVKSSKIIVYLAAIFSAFGVLILLTSLWGGGMGIARFESGADVGLNELAALAPLAVLGTLLGMLYLLISKLLTKAAAPLRERKLLRGLIGGAVVALFFFLEPWTLFSGEQQLGTLMEQWLSMGFGTLLTIGLLKLVLLNVCVNCGWKGGNIFPIIFAGFSFGFAMASVLPVDPVFAVAVVTAAMCGAVMRKPLVVIMLLLLCFPVKGIICMGAAAVVGSAIPLPRWLARPGKTVAPEAKME